MLCFAQQQKSLAGGCIRKAVVRVTALQQLFFAAARSMTMPCGDVERQGATATEPRRDSPVTDGVGLRQRRSRGR